MNTPEDKKFQSALIISTILHIILIGLFIFGVPSFFEKLPPEENIITFEMLSLSELPNVKTQSPNTKPQEEPEKAKKVEKSKKSEEPKPEEKKEEPKKEEAKKTEPEPKQEEEPKEPLKTAKAEPVPAKKEEKDALNKKTPPKKEEKKEPPKPKKKKQEEDIIDSLLKNLEEASEGEQTKSNKKVKETTENEGKYARSERFDEESPLSMTEDMLIKQQIQKNWNLQRFLGIKGIQEVRIATYIKLNQKGEVVDAIIVKNHCPPHMTDICQSLAESVIQAIWSTNTIENLAPNRYNVWGELNITFTPGNLLP